MKEKIKADFMVYTDEGSDTQVVELDGDQVGYVLDAAVEVILEADEGGTDLWAKIESLRETLQDYGVLPAKEE
jgi:hypothetical protein